MEKKKREKLNTKTTEDFWECPRCKINSLNSMEVFCARGSCEAECTGKMITTIKVIKDKK